MRKNKIDFELVECIIKTKLDLNVANKNFNEAQGDLIDYYAYQIKASKRKRFFHWYYSRIKIKNWLKRIFVQKLTYLYNIGGISFGDK